MTIHDAAQRLEVSPALVYSLVASGKLRSHRIGNGRGVLRISEDQLLAYLMGTESAPPTVIMPAAAVRRPKLKHLVLK